MAPLAEVTPAPEGKRAERVRQKICHDKCDGDRYLAIHRTAHRLGMRTNVTMLYDESPYKASDHNPEVVGLEVATSRVFRGG